MNSDPIEPEHSRILIVADDLTGGNACGALFAEAGPRTITVTGTSPHERVDLDVLLDDYDAVVLNADSRHLPARKAAELTDALIRVAGDVDLLACRIDTTLRGNVGVTAEAALEARRQLAQATGGVPRRVIGLCVPAFPAAGRTTVQGLQLLDGTLLEHTELARDVRSPMRTSEVDRILEDGTDLECHLIELSRVLQGRRAVRAGVISGISSGADVIVVDALTTEHIELVGSVVASVTREIADIPADAPGEHARLHANLRHGEVLDWVTIDPGPGGLALARSLAAHPFPRGRLRDLRLGDRGHPGTAGDPERGSVRLRGPHGRLTARACPTSRPHWHGSGRSPRRRRSSSPPSPRPPTSSTSPMPRRRRRRAGWLRSRGSSWRPPRSPASTPPAGTSPPR